MKLEGLVDSYVFEICNQLNKAQDNLNAEECEHVIELNLRAGRKALKATAFDAAAGYFQVAQELLGDNPWKMRRPLALDVYLANVERLYAATQFEEGNTINELVLMIAIRLIEEAMRHTQSPAESIPFLLRKMDCEISMGNPGGAFNTGLRLRLRNLV